MSETNTNVAKQFLDKVGLNALWEKICSTINTVVEGYIPKTINLTYNELVELRNNGNLKPGAKYRITDYVTTVNSNMTVAKSAGHMFDIIVEALDENTLSEQAKAIKSQRDRHFDTENLDAWELWYCLDNDKSRFEWADDGSVLYKAEFIGSYQTDPNGTMTMYGGVDEKIYEYSIVSHPDTGDDVIALYGQEEEYYSECGVDYSDVFIYDGIIEVDGHSYDRWKQYMNNEDSWAAFEVDADGNLKYIYYLTERMVFDGDVIWPEMNNESQGKGVIYRMIDEYGNDCPYDFKNVIYYHDGSAKYVYTFSWITHYYEVLDASIYGNNGVLTDEDIIHGVYNNVINAKYSDTIQYLNNIKFISDYTYLSNGDAGFLGCYSNTFNDNCYNNTFSNDCNANTFGVQCNNNTFGNSCIQNKFGDNCYSNTFGASVCVNILGTNCFNNTFNNNCQFNVLRANCSRNYFYESCNNNTLGNSCMNLYFRAGSRYNSIEDGASGGNIEGGHNFIGKMSQGSSIIGDFNIVGGYSLNNMISGNNNTIGQNCNRIQLLNRSNYNSFGNGCGSIVLLGSNSHNSFGNGCMSIQLGSYSSYNSFGNYCNSINFNISNGSSTKIQCCFNNHFADGCAFINIYGNGAQPTSRTPLQNLNVAQGLAGNRSTPITVTMDNYGSQYETKIAKNSNGEIKVYCEADLIA